MTPEELAYGEAKAAEWLATATPDELAEWDRAVADTPDGVMRRSLVRGYVLQRREARGEPLVRPDETISLAGVRARLAERGLL
jgi:hypothetical protein